MNTKYEVISLPKDHNTGSDLVILNATFDNGATMLVYMTLAKWKLTELKLQLVAKGVQVTESELDALIELAVAAERRERGDDEYWED